MIWGSHVAGMRGQTCVRNSYRKTEKRHDVNVNEVVEDRVQWRTGNEPTGPIGGDFLSQLALLLLSQDDVYSLTVQQSTVMSNT
jgi:hypothetical protein